MLDDMQEELEDDIFKKCNKNAKKLVKTAS